MVQPSTSVDLYALVIIGGLAFMLLVVGVVSFMFLYQKRVSEQELVVKQMELNYQQDVVYRTLDAVEDERKRVARDLHDEVGAALSAMRLLIGQIAQTVPATNDTCELTNRFKGVIDHTIDSVRRISSDLLPQGLEELGLAYALEGLCETAMDLTDVTVEFMMQTERSLPARTNLIVYRLVQELLNNATKHAEATSILLTLQETNDQFLLQYTDDGKGFDFEQAYQKRSLGLKNIETRAQMLGGQVTFDTKPGQGLRVNVTIPSTSLI